MRQSQLFTKTQKKAPKDEISISAQYLIRAGYIDKLMAGVYTLLPLGWRVFKKVEQIIRDEINAIGGVELFMPTMNPKENWEQTGRWEGFDALFKLTMGEKQIALAPTHEEIIAPLVKKHISSYKDLPRSLYHIQNKFRNEKRAKAGILRGREFFMKDLYSFHIDQADLDAYYEQVKKAYTKIFDRAGIGAQTYVTYASGGTFSKYSHEFQTESTAGEDTIFLCPTCRVAVNQEILSDLNNTCPECGKTKLREIKAIEVGNIFKLGTKYSKPFHLTYIDQAGKAQDVIMGCYGIGLQRLMGTIVEVNHDAQGMIWPESAAPFKLHLIELGQNSETVKKRVVKVYEMLVQAGQEVLYDDRNEATAGEKFADADLIGIPYRLVMSDKTVAVSSVEVKKRRENKTELIKIDKIIEYFT